MHQTLHLLEKSTFPPLRRGRVETLQVNVGYRCNQSCVHCHVNAGPNRTETMSEETIQDVLDYLRTGTVAQLDITGGAPELHPLFRELVQAARSLSIHVIDRCNLTILREPGFEDLPEFLAAHQVEVVASLPCYLEENVDQQRGKGVFKASIAALQALNSVGYGHDENRVLTLVYNPQGATLPPAQASLEAAYRQQLLDRFGVVFNRLYVLANMPIQRFGSTLVSKGQFQSYMALLRDAHREANLAHVMCRHLISVDWQGDVYDCDFNQMLGLPLRWKGAARTKLRDLIGEDLDGNPVVVRDHCYGCTAGQGSSCGGALDGN